MAETNAQFKTITLPVTYVSRDWANSTPVEYDANYAVVSGRTVMIEHEPGTPLTMPAEMADALLAQYAEGGAVEVDGPGFDVTGKAPAPSPPPNAPAPKAPPPASPPKAAAKAGS